MQVTEHQLTHYYQPTNHSCGQASIAMLLSNLGRSDTPEQVIAHVPVLSVGDVQEWGTLSQSLAKWMLDEGFAVEMHTADFQLIDLAWAGLPREELLVEMRKAAAVRNVASIGKELSEVAMRAYIDFIEAGGEFHIHPHMSSSLLNRLLENGPVFVNVSPNVLNNHGRSVDVGLRSSKGDAIRGGLDTHFVVVYGHDGANTFLVADPWTEPGRYPVESERLLCAMTAGQIQCENTIFQARTRAK